MTAPKLAFAVLVLGRAILCSAAATAAGGLPAFERVAQLPASSAATQQPSSAPIPAAVTSGNHSIGAVAIVQGSAVGIHNSARRALKRSDAIYTGDVLQTGSDGTLGVTFEDATTLLLKSNSQIAVDNFVYQERGGSNAASLDILQGTIAFIASKVAKTGTMRINTPFATLGIRGTAGIIEIPQRGGPVAVKLYADADGHVGRIEVIGRDGTQLGVLSRDVTGFAVQQEPPGAPVRFRAVELSVSPQQAGDDRALLRRTFSTQGRGEQINLQRHNSQRRHVPASPQRLNLLPPGGGSIGPTLTQPFPNAVPPAGLPSAPTAPQLPGTLPPIIPPNLPAPSPSPTLPNLPRLPGRL
jgi:hypothetical protein